MNSNTQHKQLKTRISSEDETSTAPITEASSHEDLISKDINESEAKAKERLSHADGLPFSSKRARTIYFNLVSLEILILIFS